MYCQPSCRERQRARVIDVEPVVRGAVDGDGAADLDGDGESDLDGAAVASSDVDEDAAPRARSAGGSGVRSDRATSKESR